jgi:hypothetical protein
MLMWIITWYTYVCTLFENIIWKENNGLGPKNLLRLCDSKSSIPQNWIFNFFSRIVNGKNSPPFQISFFLHSHRARKRRISALPFFVVPFLSSTSKGPMLRSLISAIFAEKMAGFVKNHCYDPIYIFSSSSSCMDRRSFRVAAEPTEWLGLKIDPW